MHRKGMASGKAGPLFTPDPDPISLEVDEALRAAASVGLDRNDFARLALLCLSEAASAFGPQARTVASIRRMMIDTGIFTPDRSCPYDWSL